MKLKDLFDKPNVEVKAEEEEHWVAYFSQYEDLTRYLKRWQGDEIWKRLLRTSFKENKDEIYKFTVFGKRFKFIQREKEII